MKMIITMFSVNNRIDYIAFNLELCYIICCIIRRIVWRVFFYESKNFKRNGSKHTIASEHS